MSAIKFVRPTSRLDIGLALMAIASIAVVAIPEEHLRTSLEIVPTRYPAQLVGDAHVGGNSKARWLDEKSQRWECKIGQAIDDSFCSMQLDVTNAQGAGMDLSRFDSMTIWVNYRGKATHLRLYLRNRHPNYYDPANSITTKYNAIEVPVRPLAQGLEVSMKDFTVAGWWLVAGNVPLAYSHPEFNDVSIIEIQTGSRVRGGTHEIQLKRIVWSGPLVRQSTLYQAVIIAWSIIVFCILGHRLLLTQRELKRQREAREELLALNALLNLETRHYEDLAKTDALTGLRNRVGIRDILHQGLINWRQRRAPFSFIIIDIDNFKAINDTYGHDAGDKVLSDAAKLMRDRIRHTDALARWGGEEFVMACPDTTLDQAVQAAEYLRMELEKRLTCGGVSVTASFGVASMDEPSLDKLFKKADTALYRAKKLGRNRVCSESIAGKSLS